MSLQDQVAQIFKDWGSDLNYSERIALEKKTRDYKVGNWKTEHIAYVVASGAASGAMGGPVGIAAIPADLLWCKKVAVQGCLGIGYILGCDVDYEKDMNFILALFADVGEPSYVIPAGKIGVKISNKAMTKIAPKVAGKVVEKIALKSGSKFAAKLAGKAATKASAKLMAKLTAKTGFGWIPGVGGAVSAGINWWLLAGLLNAAEEYYKHPYLVVKDSEVISAVY
jgi:hypothetical protein